jgi:hypothetical protein
MNKFLKFFLFIIIPIYLFELFSIGIFLLSPKTFHYRPYEYYSEITYPSKNIPSQWNDIATSDLTRDNFFLYQDPRNILNTSDKYGFRSQPSFEEAGIVFTGDSTIWGASLNDNETVPWKLQELINKPVLNAARTSTFNGINHPHAKKMKVLFDCLTERHNKVSKFDKVVEEDFKPLESNEIDTKFELFKQVSPNRYSFVLRTKRLLKRIGNDIKETIQGLKTFLFLNHKMPQDEHVRFAKKVKERANYFTIIGIHYVYCPVPAKQSIYGENINPYLYDYLNNLYKELDDLGVNYVDLLNPLRSASKTEQVYHNYDTHWNDAGTTVAAKVFENYLRKNNLLQD